MKILRLAILLGLAALLIYAAFAHADEPRDPAQVRAFRKTHPCPATGKTIGECKGWVVDHKYPLCAGGKDEPSNMEWELYGPSLAKDTIEKELCRCKAGK